MQPIYEQPKSKLKPKQKRKTQEELVLAPFGRRLIAFVIDSIILSVIGSVLYYGGDATGGAASAIIGGAYYWYFLTAERGQTPGKRIMNIRVIKTDGSRITDKDALVRYVGYWVSAVFMLLGFIWAFFDRSSQAWHDKLAHTYVVWAD